MDTVIRVLGNGELHHRHVSVFGEELGTKAGREEGLETGRTGWIAGMHHCLWDRKMNICGARFQYPPTPHLHPTPQWKPVIRDDSIQERFNFSLSSLPRFTSCSLALEPRRMKHPDPKEKGRERERGGKETNKPRIK